MRKLAKLVSALALGGTLVPPALFVSGTLELETMKAWMLLATLVWFVATPLWMDRPAKN